MHSEAIAKLEEQMLPVKAAMEQRGLNVNVPELEELIAETEQRKRDIEEQLKSMVGEAEGINFNSSRDVAEIMMENLGVKPRYTRTGRVSTSRRILKNVNNPLTNIIIHYRDAETLLSSLKGLLEATDKDTGKVSCTYVDHCPSGRIYTKNYNLQGIPEEGRRVVFADEGFTFILADYDAFELKILSALAHDTYFKRCWDSGLDLHKKVVADMKNISYNDVTPGERKLGKVLNFGLAYGQEPYGLAQNLNIQVEEAEQLMATYKSNIPEIEQFKLEVIDKARKTGFAETYFGRKRFIPNILARNTAERKKAERQAVNTKIQGSAADIVKYSLVELHDRGFLINTMLHDGILISARDHEVVHSIERIRSIMETEVEGMKFTVTIKKGKTWGACS